MIKGICKNKCLKDVYEAKEVDDLLTNVEMKINETIANNEFQNKMTHQEINYEIGRLDNEIQNVNKLIDYNVNGKLATIKCVFTHNDAAQLVQMNYPTGFNKENCVVISVMCKVNDTERDAWRTGNTDDQHMLTYNAGMYNSIVSLERDCIHAYVKPLSNIVTTGGQLKIVLMKV